MSLYLGVESGCTTIVLPGWSAIVVVAIVALAGSPRGRRLIVELLRGRSTG